MIVYVNWEGIVYNLCKLALNVGWGGLREMVLLLLSLIKMVWV